MFIREPQNNRRREKFGYSLIIEPISGNAMVVYFSASERINNSFPRLRRPEVQGRSARRIYIRIYKKMDSPSNRNFAPYSLSVAADENRTDLLLLLLSIVVISSSRIKNVSYLEMYVSVNTRRPIYL